MKTLNGTHVDMITIDAANAENLTLSDLLDSVRYVPLESNNESLIGKIDRIFFSNEKVIVVDKSITQAIFIFNREGKFLNKIKKVGKGPGEYQIIKDVVLDDKKGVLELYDSQSDNLIEYDLEGFPVAQRKMKYRFSSFVKIDDAYIVSANKAVNKDASGNELNYSFLSIDKSGNKLLKAYFMYDKDAKVDNRSFELQQPLVSFGDAVFMTKLFCDTLYVYKEQHFKPLLVFDYGSYGLPPYLSSDDIPSDVAAELIFAKTITLLAIPLIA